MHVEGTEQEMQFLRWMRPARIRENRAAGVLLVRRFGETVAIGVDRQLEAVGQLQLGKD